MTLFKFDVVVVEISEFLYFSALEAVAVGKDGRKIHGRYCRVLSVNIASTCLDLTRIKIGHLGGKIYSTPF
jgi:hypothetical protein